MDLFEALGIANAALNESIRQANALRQRCAVLEGQVKALGEEIAELKKARGGGEREADAGECGGEATT